MNEPRLAGLLAGINGAPDDLADLLGDIDERLRRPAWQRHAACKTVDPGVFYPTKGRGDEEAKAICEVCPCRAPCLAHALERPEHEGIWGGLNERERRSLRRRNARQAG